MLAHLPDILQPESDLSPVMPNKSYLHTLPKPASMLRSLGPSIAVFHVEQGRLSCHCRLSTNTRPRQGKRQASLGDQAGPEQCHWHRQPGQHRCRSKNCWQSAWAITHWQTSMQLEPVVAMQLDSVVSPNPLHSHLGDPNMPSCASSPSTWVSSPPSSSGVNTPSCDPSGSLSRGWLVTCRLCGVGPMLPGGCSSLHALAGCRAGRRRACGRLPTCSGNRALFSCSRRSRVTPGNRLDGNSSQADLQAGNWT